MREQFAIQHVPRATRAVHQTVLVVRVVTHSLQWQATEATAVHHRSPATRRVRPASTAPRLAAKAARTKTSCARTSPARRPAHPPASTPIQRTTSSTASLVTLLVLLVPAMLRIAVSAVRPEVVSKLTIHASLYNQDGIEPAMVHASSAM